MYITLSNRYTTHVFRNVSESWICSTMYMWICLTMYTWLLYISMYGAVCILHKQYARVCIRCRTFTEVLYIGNIYTWVRSRMKLRVIIQYVHFTYMSTVCMCVYIVEHIHGSCHVWRWHSCQRSWESCFHACHGYIWGASVLQCVLCDAMHCRTYTWVLSLMKLTVMSTELRVMPWLSHDSQFL